MTDPATQPQGYHDHWFFGNIFGNAIKTSGMYYSHPHIFQGGNLSKDQWTKLMSAFPNQNIITTPASFEELAESHWNLK